MATQLIHLTNDEDQPEIPVSVESLDDDRYAVNVNGTTYEVEAFRTEKGIAFRLEGRSRDVSVDRRDARTTVVEVLGQQSEFELVDHRLYQLEKAMLANAGPPKPIVLSPMSGKVILVNVTPGDTVEEGDTLLIVEAMKMENEIKSSRGGVVTQIDFAAGDSVDTGATLLTLAPHTSEDQE